MSGCTMTSLISSAPLSVYTGPGALLAAAGGEGVRALSRLQAATILAAVALVQPASSLAHPGAPIAPHDLPTAWNIAPLLLGGLAAFAWLYGCGIANAWRALGRGQVVPPWRASAGAAGLLVLVIALISPLDALAGTLFSAHMVQHLLLVLIAAPLLVAAASPLALLWSLAPAWRPHVTRWSRATPARLARRMLAEPVAALVLFAAVVWLWHLPLLYEAALRNEIIHGLEHVTLLGTAVLFWWALIQPIGRRRVGYGTGVILAFAAMLQGTVLGALIAFSDVPWYRAYAIDASAWGLSPLDDQRLAGAIMLVPSGFVFLLAGLVLLTRLLGDAAVPRSAIRPSEQGAG